MDYRVLLPNQDAHLLFIDAYATRQWRRPKPVYYGTINR